MTREEAKTLVNSLTEEQKIALYNFLKNHKPDLATLAANNQK